MICSPWASPSTSHGVVDPPLDWRPPPEESCPVAPLVMWDNCCKISEKTRENPVKHIWYQYPQIFFRGIMIGNIGIIGYTVAILPSGDVNSLLLKMTNDKKWVFPFKMVIVHSYVKLPEGESWLGIFGTECRSFSWYGHDWWIFMNIDMHGNVAVVVHWGLAGIDVAFLKVFRGVICQENAAPN